MSHNLMLIDMMSPDIHNLDSYHPAEISELGFLLDLTISNSGSMGADRYSLTICSATWLQKEFKNQFLFLKNFLLIPRYNIQEIELYLKELFLKIGPHSKRDLNRISSGLAQWEFDNSYQSIKSNHYYELRSISSTKYSELNSLQVEDESFCIIVDIRVGVLQAPLEAKFTMKICNEKWIEENYQNRYALLKNHFLVPEFDFNKIEARIAKLVKSYNGYSWENFIDSFSGYAHWESELYDPNLLINKTLSKDASSFRSKA